MQSKNLWVWSGCVDAQADLVWSALVVYMSPFAGIIVRNDLTAPPKTNLHSLVWVYTYRQQNALHPQQCELCTSKKKKKKKNKKKKVHYIKYADRWKSNSLRFSHWWLRLTQYTASRKYWPDVLHLCGKGPCMLCSDLNKNNRSVLFWSILVSMCVMW